MLLAVVCKVSAKKMRHWGFNLLNVRSYKNNFLIHHIYEENVLQEKEVWKTGIFRTNYHRS